MKRLLLLAVIAVSAFAGCEIGEDSSNSGSTLNFTIINDDNSENKFEYKSATGFYTDDICFSNVWTFSGKTDNGNNYSGNINIKLPKSTFTGRVLTEADKNTSSALGFEFKFTGITDGGSTVFCIMDQPFKITITEWSDNRAVGTFEGILVSNSATIKVRGDFSSGK